MSEERLGSDDEGQIDKYYSKEVRMEAGKQ